MEDALDTEAAFVPVLAGVQDPGNVGALARSAWCLGARCLVADRESADPLSPKSLRASSGMALRLQISWIDREALLPALAARRQRILCLSAGARPFDELPPMLERPVILVLGSEAHGVPVEILRMASLAVGIPMRREAESLGVAAAGAIAFFLLSRQGRGR